MNKKCILKTEGYEVFFYLRKLNYQLNNVGVIVKFVLDSRLGQVTVTTRAFLISLQDFYRLVKYFEQHIVNLKENPDVDSYTFVTYGLNFQLKALSGTFISDCEGILNLQFFINVGQIDKCSSRTYIGGESTITFENVRNFTSSLQVALAEMFDSIQDNFFNK